MNIVIVSAYNIGNETGTAKVSERLSKYLSKKHQVLYLCLGKKYKLLKVSKKLSYLTIPSIVVSNLWIPAITPKVKDKIFKDLSNFSPDVIHAQNIIFTGLIALVWAKENSVAFVVTFHSFPTEGFRYVFPKLKNSKVVSTIDYRLTSGYIKYYLKNIDLIIALNTAMFSSVKELKSSTRVKIINNGLNLDRFYNLKIIHPGKNIKFIYLGTYSGRKNQEFLIKAFKYLPINFRLNLYGNLKSGQYYLRKLNKLISEQNIKNVNINNFLSEEGVCKALERSHYFVSSSIKEVQSLVVVEALAAGLPVIGLRNETIDEVLTDKNGLKIPQVSTPKQFAKKLQAYVINTSDNYEKLAIDCRISVKRFDMNKVTKDIINVYRSVVKEKRKQKYKNSQQSINQIDRLVPKQVKDLIEEKVPKKIKKSKPNFLKVFLLVTVIFSVIATGIMFIYKILIRLNKKN